MIYLVDTSVLLRLADRADPSHSLVRNVIRHLREEGNELHTSVQNYIEFWTAATRPAEKNGWGLTPDEAHKSLRLVERIFPMLSPLPAAYSEWRRLVVTFGVSGVKTHDAHLVAVMLACGLTHILTFNVSDFARYSPEGIVVIDPNTLAPSP